jgi:hypothetical protein
MDQLIWLPSVRTFRWEASDKDTIAEVNEYIGVHLPKNMTNSVKLVIEQHSYGNILVASRLLDALQDEGLSLIERGGGTLTLDKLFQYEWEYRILQHAEDRDLCEDIATLFAAARAPLSTAIITAGIRHIRGKEVRGRHVEQALGQMRTHLESFKGKGHICLRPFHPSFARWLEEFYRNDLCEAHRAIALAFIAILKDAANLDFICAARCVCRHLREWASRAPDSSQRNQALAYLGEIVHKKSICSEVEHRAGIDVYLNCFLYESVKCAEVVGSLPELIHFGVHYMDYQQKSHSRVDYLEELLEQDKFGEAISIASTLPAENEVLACLAFIGCRAADNNYREILVEVLDRISAKYETGFKVFIPIAWSLIGRLINLREKELLVRLISTISDKEFMYSANYLRETLCAWSYSYPGLSFIGLFLGRVARFDRKTLYVYVPQFAKIAFDSNLPHEHVADLLLDFLHSVKGEKARFVVGEVLGEMFIERHLDAYAQRGIVKCCG